MLKIYVNAARTVHQLAGILKCNGEKIEEAEKFKCVFNVYCVLESK